ncbi:MAG: type II toxin-antitoxin system RelE/ParE family toxin [Alphaproteobacteria bacterium]|nr:type II toxin-antitoxin system RelE/ParE family toxin [Alphaproteobacteria bacterium]
MVYNTPSGWVVGYGDDRVEKEVNKLADDVHADLLHVTDMIEHYGLENVHAPFVKHLRGKLWEIRVRGRDGIARAAYVAASGKRVVILHVFVKKTQKTPEEIIDLAIKRGKELGYI